MEINLEIEVKGRIISSNPDAMDPYFITVKELFEGVELNKYTLSINDKLEEFPDLFHRVLSHNRLVDFEKEFTGWYSVGEIRKEFLSPTKMKDINSDISQYIYSLRERRYYIKVYFKSV